MKPEQVNKLYNKLTPHEQAALCVDASSRQDRTEFDAIADNVQRVSYLCVNTDYQHRLMGLYNLAGIYGIAYWKSRALMMTALHASDNLGGYEGLAIEFSTQMASMSAALIDACRIYRVDVDAIKALASCKGEPTFDSYAKPELIEQYADWFKRAVDFK